MHCISSVHTQPHYTCLNAVVNKHAASAYNGEKTSASWFPASSCGGVSAVVPPRRSNRLVLGPHAVSARSTVNSAVGSFGTTASLPFVHEQRCGGYGLESGASSTRVAFVYSREGCPCALSRCVTSCSVSIIDGCTQLHIHTQRQSVLYSPPHTLVKQSSRSIVVAEGCRPTE